MSTKMPGTVQRIIHRVLNGETEAYAEIIQYYQNDLWKVVIALLHDVQKTETLVEQVFVEAYLSLRRFEAERDFGLWLKAIARNLVRQELRALSREGNSLQAYRRHLTASLQNDEKADAQQQQLVQSLQRCQEGLSPEVSQALELRYADSKSFEEIAHSLGRTVGATRQLLVRTRINLRNCIEKRMAQV